MSQRSFRETYPGPWEIIEHEESISVRHNEDLSSQLGMEL